MKTLFIAEKPSLAKEYKSMLEAVENQSFQSKDGYFESDKYYLSWCYGHLVGLSEPEQYGWGEWDLDTLPMIPEEWKYSVKNDSGAKKQFNTLKSLISKSSSVVNGADPDREGELIVRLVLHMSGNSKINQDRYWSKSLTMKDLTHAWKTKQSAKAFNNLYSSASCRQRADWLVGMNLSRAYALKSNVKGISIGRVQTPTLAMIVKRDLEIENWTQAFFNEIHTTWNNLPFHYIGTDNSTRTPIEFITDAEKQESFTIVSNCTSKTCSVETISSKNKTVHPPLMYNLADLQKSANSKFGMTAEQTLSNVQSLYEKKLLSYPRTDCNYLSEDMYEECKTTLNILLPKADFQQYLNRSMPKSFNSKKITAHTALIPVGTDSSKITETESKIFNLVVQRFIVAFGQPKEITETKVDLKCNEYFFASTHNHTTNHGFDNLTETKLKESVEFPTSISNSSSESFSNIETVEKERTKPKHYTESTLLTAMENCARNILDEELRATLKSVNGIGTPATRSGIFQGLKKRNYVEIKKNSIISTEKGRTLIQAISPDITSAEMTAQWEQQLSQIEDGSLNWKSFYDSICEFTKRVVTEAKSTKSIVIKTKDNQLHKCPKCDAQTLKINKYGAFCTEDSSCALKVFKKQFGKSLTEKALNDLLYKGKTSKMMFTSKKRKKYEARLIRDNNFTISISFD